MSSEPDHLQAPAGETSLQMRASPRLASADLQEMAGFGEEQSLAEGELLFEAGEANQDLHLVLEGLVELFRPEAGGEIPVSTFAAGSFIGELSLLTGQRRVLSARVAEPARIAVIPQPQFRRLMSLRPALGETILAALVARREQLRAGRGAEAIRILGSRFSAEAMSLRAFADHSRLPYTWMDVEREEEAVELLRARGLAQSDTPVVITPTGTLRRPSPAVLAENLGLTFTPTPGYMFDLVVVGSGPAGLAAAVYGASEGLSTVCLDAVAVGGQAGSSSRIENYAGFPNGISGEDLTGRAAVQAMRLGARLNAPCEVVGLSAEPGFHLVRLSDGSEIATRAVIVASGARYRRLPLPELERFEGAGVYYAATDLEARVCDGSPVIVVGGGNSAGQAAIYLAQHNCAVTIAIRREDLAATMSSYLIERIEADPVITVKAGVQVSALAGEQHLEAVTLTDLADGQERQMACSGLFCFIGAEPATGWLGDCVTLDEHGFVLTDRQLPYPELPGAAEPLPFETSRPSVFAAGDVRHGSMKRVAAAVGEGSSAVRSVHERLAAKA